MTATVADLTAAQNGLRIAVIARTHHDARTEVDHLARFAGPDATIRRAKDNTVIDYGTGHVRWLSSLGTWSRGARYERVHLAEDAVTDDDLITRARAALTPNGELYIGAHLVDDDRDDAGS